MEVISGSHGGPYQIKMLKLVVRLSYFSHHIIVTGNLYVSLCQPRGHYVFCIGNTKNPKLQFCGVTWCLLLLQQRRRL